MIKVLPWVVVMVFIFCLSALELYVQKVMLATMVRLLLIAIKRATVVALTVDRCHHV